jgi:hypothetical protein
MSRAIGVAPVWACPELRRRAWPLDEVAKPPASAIADDLRNVRRLINFPPDVTIAIGLLFGPIVS